MKSKYIHWFVKPAKGLIASALVFSFLAIPLRQVAAEEVEAAPAPESSQNSIDATMSEPAPDPEASLQAEASQPAVDSAAPEAAAEEKPDPSDDEEKPKDEEPPQQSLMDSEEENGIYDQNQVGGKKAFPEADKVSGALTYSYPLTVPPGRNGLTPSVALKYNSQDTSEGSIAGYGWSIDIPYIERLNKTGTDKLYTDNYFTSSLDGELVLLGSGSYAPKVENGSFLKYSLSSNVWTVKDKSGTVYKFGTNAAERQDKPGDSSTVFKCMLQEVRDANNNYIKYEYFKDGGQIYPDTITYTGNGSTDGPFEIEFLGESRSDATKSYHPGFLVTTSYRISEIKAKVSGTWVHKYAFAYSAGANTVRSLLSSITESGQTEAGSGSISKPATSFSYTQSSPGFTKTTNTTFSPIDIKDGVAPGDVNSDGYADLIRAYEETVGTPSTTKDVWLYDQENETWDYSSDWPVPDGILLFSEGASSYEGGTKVMDVDGDFKTDLIRRNSLFYESVDPDPEINDGLGWTQDTDWDPEQDGYAVADLNGDTLIDYIGDIPNGGGGWSTKISLNNGTGYDLTTQTGAGLFRTPELTHKHVFVDVNGDGLADIIKSTKIDIASPPSTSYDHEVYLNTGTGWVEDNSWTIPDDIVIFYDGSGTDEMQRVYFQDMNYDGLVDIVVPYAVDVNNNRITNIQVFLNKGNTWDADDDDWYALAVVKDDNCACQNPALIFDMNGDGSPDILNTTLSGPTVTSDAYYNNTHVPVDLLSTITFSEGGSASATYKPSTQYVDGNGDLLNPALPLTIHTVSQITLNDGMGNSANTTYSYAGGLYYYSDAFDRRFAGFATITKTDPAGNKTVTYNHQGNSTNSSQGEYSDHSSKIGKPYRIEQLDSSGNKYAVTTNKWDKYNQGTGRDFVKLANTVSFTYDGDSDHKDIATAFNYDDSTGNLTDKIEWGEVTGSADGTFSDTGSDKFTTTIAYATNSSPYLQMPKTETVVDQSSVKVRESKFYYDGQSHGTVNVGNLTKEEKWKVSSTYINSQKTYDGTYGLVTVDTDPRGKTTTYTYDANNLYPELVTNELDHETSYTYDYSSGKVKETTDPNSLVFETVYDGLDRVVEEKQPDQTTPASLVTRTAYTYTDTSGAVKVQKNEKLDGSTSVDTYIYFDGFHRPIQTRQEMEDGNYAVTDTIYNNVEQVYKESIPYSSSGSSKTSATATSSLLITYSYDPILRVTSVADAVGTVSTAYDDWKTTITDKRSKTKDLYKDAYGQLIKVDEHNSASTYTTLYEYNGNGLLTKITDALSNIRNFTYDGLSRRLTAQDLHASADSYYGSWSYTYDDSGNLTQTVDPKSQTINYTYDDINRRLTENYTGTGGDEVTYTYDTCDNGIGRLCETEVTGVTTSEYDYAPTGQVSQEYENTSSQGFTTTYTYDRQGNQLEITNPDSSKVKYTYNTAGQPETIQRKEASDGGYTNVVTDFDYGVHGKVTYQANQNGTNTTNTYDSTKLYRLSDKDTVNSGATKFQDLAYTYDNNGNITRIVDASNTNSSKTVDYTYDDLNRLTQAAATSVAGGQSTYTHNYTYDAIGNITNRSDVGDYSYAGNTGTSQANPHAVTSFGNDFATYDNNGNAATVTSGGAPVTIAHDATTTSITNGYNGTITKDWSHTTSSGSNRLLVLSADLWQDVGGTGSITSASYNGVALTKANSTREGGMQSEIWYLVNPASGSHMVSVTVTGATDSIKLAASTFTGVDQTTPYVASNTVTGSSGNPSITRTTTVANSLLTATLSRYSTTSATTNRTSLYNNATGSTLGAASYQVTTSTGSYSDTYTGSASQDWSMVAAEFRPAWTGTTTTNTWNYKNQLTQSADGSTTVTYAYDHSGQRIKYANGTTTTYFPTKTYSTNGTLATKHIFSPGGELVATVESTPATTSTITLDATSSSITNGYNGTITKTWTHTTSSGSNRLLVLSADLWQDVAGTGTVTSTSYNGVALTKANSTRQDGMQSEIWYLVNPASGSNTMSVTVTGATDAIKLAASTFTGAAQSSVLDANNTATGDSGNPSVSVTTTAASDLVTATLSRYSTTSATTNRTSLYNNATGSTLGAASYQLATSTGSYSDTYTGSASQDWSMVIAAWRPYTTAGTTTVYYDHTDHLTGSNVVSTSAGAQEEMMDYFPYGNIRIDDKAGSFSEKRKYAGHEYDADTGFSYMEARYYKGYIGRFLSQDEMFLSLGFDLTDPQSLNSYAYSRNNPLRYADPDGEAFRDYVNAVAGYGVGLAQGVGNAAVGLGNAVIHPIRTLDNASILVTNGIVAGGQLAGDLYNNPGQTLNEIGTGFKLSYNEFETKTAYEQGKSVGNIFGQIEFGTATSYGMSKAANALKAPRLAPVQLNQARGDAFRDTVAQQLMNDGRIVKKEVVKPTLFGPRRVDLEIKDSKGNILGGVEAKTGNSRYTPSQRAKDTYLKWTGYPVNVIRDK